MYAIVKTGGKQYTVRPGDELDVEKLPGEAGDTVSLQVLLVSDDGTITTDAAALERMGVTAEILEQHKGDKQIVFKFKKRKGYKRTKGHRQQLTRIRIVEVAGEKAAPKPKPAPKEASEKEPEETKEAAPQAGTEATKPADETPAAEASEEPADEASTPEASEEPAAEEAAPEAEAETAPEPAGTSESAESAEELAKLTVAQLKELAKERDIRIPSGARKAEIVDLIANA